MDKQPLSLPPRSVAVAFTGSGGSGAVTAGLILLSAAAKAGFYGLLTRSAGPQIRGGESAAMVRIAAAPVDCIGDRFDILVGLDWRNVDRFAEEILLDSNSLILADPAVGDVPEVLTSTGAEIRHADLKVLASTVADGRINMASVGIAGAAAGLPLQALEEGALATLGRKEVLSLTLQSLASVPVMGRCRGYRRSRWVTRSSVGISAVTRRPGLAHCAAACVSWRPIRSPRPARCWSGWLLGWKRSAAPCCRPRTSWRR